MTGDIEKHVSDIYGISVQDSAVSFVTDKMLPMDLKYVYSAVGEKTALHELDGFDSK